MTRLSNRQFPMLATFTDRKASYHMSIPEAQAFDQRPFRSMLIQGWIAYTPLRGFHATEKGREAMKEFLHTDIARKDPTQPLTRLFDPAAYGLKPVERKKGPGAVREMRQSGAA